MRDFILTKMPFGDRELITAALLEDGIITELIAEEAGRPSRIGNVYAGIVDSVSGNIGGAFVDIGVKQDGLVHISQMSRKYVGHPMDVVSVGDTVRVKILSVDRQRQKISLTMIL